MRSHFLYLWMAFYIYRLNINTKQNKIICIDFDIQTTKQTEHEANLFSHCQSQLFPVWAADEFPPCSECGFVQHNRLPQKSKQFP